MGGRSSKLCSVLCRHRASNMFLEGYKRNWLYTEGFSFEDRMIDDLSVSGISNMLHLDLLFLCAFAYPSSVWTSQKAMEQEEGDEEEEKETKPDPLHQLILHFSRTALTEKRSERSTLIAQARHGQESCCSSDLLLLSPFQ